MRITTVMMNAALAAVFLWLGMGLYENALQTRAAREHTVSEKPLEITVTKVTPRVVAELPQLPDPRVKQTPISDGQFDQLSEKWRQGVRWLVRTSLCDAYDRIIWKSVGQDRKRFWLAKAQMMVESGCRPTLVGNGTDYGLFQVQKAACADVGITGNLLDPVTNIKCATAYKSALCWQYGRCSPTQMFVGYNAGPTGAKRVDDEHAFEYARKIDFAFRLLVSSS